MFSYYIGMPNKHNVRVKDKYKDTEIRVVASRLYNKYINYE